MHLADRRELERRFYDPGALAANAYEHAFRSDIRRAARVADYERAFDAHSERIWRDLVARTDCKARWVQFGSLGWSIHDPEGMPRREVLSGPPWPRPFASTISDDDALAASARFEAAWATLIAQVPDNLPYDCPIFANAIVKFRDEQIGLITDTRRIRRRFTELQAELVDETRGDDGDHGLTWFGIEQTCAGTTLFDMAARQLFAP